MLSWYQVWTIGKSYWCEWRIGTDNWYAGCRRRRTYSRTHPPTNLLTLWEPQSRFGDKPVKFRVVRTQNGTAVLKGFRLQSRLKRQTSDYVRTWSREVFPKNRTLFFRSHQHLLSSLIYRTRYISFFCPQRSSGQAVVTGVAPSPPRYVPFIFCRA